jgi:endogenous inhibitor of DNA gyrase (YacG/DUF329 family)
MSNPHPNLAACPDCGRMCSRRSTSCVNCGAPLNWSAAGGLSPFIVGGLFAVGLLLLAVVAVWLLGYVRL